MKLLFKTLGTVFGLLGLAMLAQPNCAAKCGFAGVIKPGSSLQLRPNFGSIRLLPAAFQEGGNSNENGSWKSTATRIALDTAVADILYLALSVGSNKSARDQHYLPARKMRLSYRFPAREFTREIRRRVDLYIAVLAFYPQPLFFVARKGGSARLRTWRGMIRPYVNVHGVLV